MGENILLKIRFWATSKWKKKHWKSTESTLLFAFQTKIDKNCLQQNLSSNFVDVQVCCKPFNQLGPFFLQRVPTKIMIWQKKVRSVFELFSTSINQENFFSWPLVKTKNGNRQKKWQKSYFHWRTIPTFFFETGHQVLLEFSFLLKKKKRVLESSSNITKMEETCHQGFFFFE